MSQIRWADFLTKTIWKMNQNCGKFNHHLQPKRCRSKVCLKYKRDLLHQTLLIEYFAVTKRRPTYWTFDKRCKYLEAWAYSMNQDIRHTWEMCLTWICYYATRSFVRSFGLWIMISRIDKLSVPRGQFALTNDSFCTQVEHPQLWRVSQSTFKRVSWYFAKIRF